MSELRECPFCGLPLMIEEGQIGGYVLQHQARSEECPLATNIDGGNAPVQLIYSNRKHLEDVINHRPLESALRAENAKLREALEKVTEFSGDPFKTGLWTFQGEIDAMKKISQEALKNE